LLQAASSANRGTANASQLRDAAAQALDRAAAAAHASQMQTFIALLRAINVGGTGKLPMADLKNMCRDSGFFDVRTYIASGNVILRSPLDEAGVKRALEARLQGYAGKPVGVVVRTYAEMAAIVAENPFSQAPGHRVTAIFLDHPVTASMLDNVTGRAEQEHIELGRREIFVHYGDGQAVTKLRIPASRNGTARSMNTVAKLAALSAV
jgi:uncharacterized protein (DUF1697 family)